MPPVAPAYSRPLIRLHWITAALVVVQLATAGAMAAAWDMRRPGGAPDLGPPGWLHLIGGAAILLLVAARLGLRRRHGVPPAAGGPWWRLTARLGHLALYAALTAMALTGVMAWAGGLESAAASHRNIRLLLLALIAGHVVAALYHHFIRRNGTLLRMR